jgi:hypothetical protein
MMGMIFMMAIIKAKMHFGFAVIVIKHIWNWMNAVKRYLGRETGGAYLAIGFIVITHNAINLRLIAWLCLRNDDYRNSQMCTVTVPNIDLAIKSIKRMKTLFEPKLHVTFDSKEKVYGIYNITQYETFEKKEFCI